MAIENRPLIKKLVDFKEKKPVSFHVPGHKNGTLSGLPIEIRTALTYDFTELTGLDDLHQPEGVIEEAENKLSKLYRADKSFFLVNGSTVGNLAMIYATCGEGDFVIVQRNAHKSIFNAIELTGARPVFVTPQWDEERKIAGSVTAAQIKDVITQYPTVQAVIITYPTYYGTADQELSEIISICHRHDVPVLVDEAHGAHFVIGEPFPKSALAMGADIVVHSAHKTLPAMTMASFLHVKSKLVKVERVAHYLQMLQSSSPSYLLMASLDDARAYAASFGEEEVNGFLKNRTLLIERLARVSELQIIEPDDYVKLILRVSRYSGFELLRALEEQGIYAELADPYQVLFVLPLSKEENLLLIEEIGGKIEVAIKKLQEKVPQLEESMPFVAIESITVPSYTIKEIEQFQTAWLYFEQATGKVAAASIIPYPPGIPLLLVGERITDMHIQSLKGLLDMGANFQGAIQVKEKQICVVINESEE